MSNWTLFSNHGHVLVCLSRDSKARLRDVAADVGITERAVQKIVRDLQDHGMVSITKHGRRNRYQIHNKKTLRHNLESHCTLGDLVDLVNSSSPPAGLMEKARSIEPAKPNTDPPESTPVKSVQTGSALTSAGPVKSEPKTAGTRKTETTASIEKQQGLLF